jgi:heme/copper-type cytochrome/quinol oxidase subunit 2
MSQEGPQEVYLMAYQWGFEPSYLRLEAGKPYRFSMMAVDAAHGATIQLGKGSLVNRLRKGVLSERVITFPEKGTFLVYCTVYCGLGHDRMQGKIVVE